MAKSLIIVESPAKTKTLKNFLGARYQVEASVGHVRDLPDYGLGVKVDDGFKPTYVVRPDRKEIIARLAEAAKKADAVYLASDPDREGEAIAWHLAQALKLKDPKRITYNELTRSAVEEAIQNPRLIDSNLVNAQEARRVLDRLVGYRLSPLLSSKIRSKLSAGRVQSVAVRLVCEREREIQAFVPEEYWSLTATLTPQPPLKRFPFEAKFVGRAREKAARLNEEQKLDAPQELGRAAYRVESVKNALRNEGQAQEILRDLDGAAYRVESVKKREQRRNPAAPFITSTLQQEASRKLGFGNRRTMTIAQQLYEGIELGAEGAVGLITYMRTDSTRVAAEALQEARQFIETQYGRDYLPQSPRQYANRSAAQDAHEAVRPTSVVRTPESVSRQLSAEQLKLYRLIWQRFVASQMQSALFDVTTADIAGIPGAGDTLSLPTAYIFRATGSVVRFDGFMRIYTEGKDTEEKTDEERDPLPPLDKGQSLDLISLLPKQHFTEPPPRFTEATLVKALEEKGIGRPSTYASIISTIQERKYVELAEKKFRPTDLGFQTNDLLVQNFPNVLDVGFTAGMENQLDAVEEGQMDKVTLLSEFYSPFDRTVNEAFEKIESVKPKAVETEYACPKCGKPMLLRQSARGPFLGCSGYPRCRTTMNVDAEGRPVETEASGEPAVTDQACPKCGKPLLEREGRFGKFLGCSGYPRCKTIVRLPGDEGPSARNGSGQAESTGVKCPKDGGELLVKRSRRGATFYGCSNYPACEFTTWHRPIGRDCPQCGYPLGEQSFRGRSTGAIRCTNPDCDHSEKAAAEQAAAAASQ